MNHKRFCDALVKKGVLNIDEWEYCGGNENSPSFAYLDDFVKFFGHMGMPLDVSNCICGTRITYNCYITSKTEQNISIEQVKYNGRHIPILIVGSCCIKHFMDGTKLKCEQCGELHRRNKCEKNLCLPCKKERDLNIKREQERKRTMHRDCMDCFKEIKKPFFRCYNCNILHKTPKVA
jgi:hypothetical protein